MLFLVECNRPAIWPGYFRSTLGGRPFRRFYFLWFAVAWWPGDLKEYGEAVRDAEWRNGGKLFPLAVHPREVRRRGMSADFFALVVVVAIGVALSLAAALLIHQ